MFAALDSDKSMVVLNELVELQEPTNLVTRDDSQMPVHLQQHHFAAMAANVNSPNHLHQHMGSLGRKISNNGSNGRPHRLSSFRPLHGQHADLIRECIEERMTGPTYETIDPHHLRSVPPDSSRQGLTFNYIDNTCIVGSESAPTSLSLSGDSFAHIDRRSIIETKTLCSIQKSNRCLCLFLQSFRIFDRLLHSERQRLQLRQQHRPQQSRLHRDHSARRPLLRHSGQDPRGPGGRLPAGQPSPQRHLLL